MSAHGTAKPGKRFVIAGANQECGQAGNDQNIVRTVLELIFRFTTYLGHAGLPLRGQSHRDEVLWQLIMERQKSRHNVMICPGNVSGFSKPQPFKRKYQNFWHMQSREEMCLS